MHRRRRTLTAIRPDRLVAPEWNGRAGPEGRGLGQLEGRLQMAKPAKGRVRLGAELRRVAGSGRVSRVAGRAEPDEPHPAPAERRAHVIAAALPCAPTERHERAE